MLLIYGDDSPLNGVASAKYDSTLGLLEVGILVSVFLFTVCTVQAYEYFQKCGNDRWWMKTLVSFVWLLELTHMGLSASSVYWYTVTNYGKVETLKISPRVLSFNGIVSVTITSSVQAYFAFRLRELSQKWTIPCICWFLSFLRFVSFLVAISRSLASIHGTPKSWRWVFTAVGGLSTGADLLMGLSLCHLMWSRRAEIGILGNWNKRAVDKLAVWSLQTDMLTAVSTLVTMIMFKTMSNFAWVAMSFIVCRLFSISLLSSLLARDTLRNTAVHVPRGIDSLPNFSGLTPIMSPDDSSNKAPSTDSGTSRSNSTPSPLQQV